MSASPLDHARLQLGFITPPDHRTPWGVWYASHGEDKSFEVGPDCAMFVSWCRFKAGCPLPEMQHTGYPGFAKALYGLHYCHDHGLVVPTAAAEPGDLIFFDWNGDGADHVGLVELAPADGLVTTIEANTGHPHGVYRRWRPLTHVCAVARMPEPRTAPRPCWDRTPPECPV